MILRHRLYIISAFGYIIFLPSSLVGFWGADHKGTYADWMQFVGVGQSIFIGIGIAAMWLWYGMSD